jgi:hypothetical protein
MVKELSEQQNSQTAVQVEPIVIVRKIPRCVVCFERDQRITPMVANGEALTHCLVCGTAAPEPEPEQVVEAIPAQAPRRWWPTRAWLDMLKWELFRRKMT